MRPGADEEGRVAELRHNVARVETQLQEIRETLPRKNGTYLQIIVGNVNVSILNKADRMRPGADEEGRVAELRHDVARVETQLQEIRETLPRKNGTYLQIIVGNVNVSILNKADRPKQNIGVRVSFTRWQHRNVVSRLVARVLDAIFLFLLVWYYCTLTIRESILQVNGSRVKGWWRAHHYISTVLSGLIITWPDGPVYRSFRNQFMWFCLYIAIVQLFQYQYQRGCLYRLKALGERHNMDITIDGFHQWMWKGLTFLLPFLAIGYVFQLYNAYVLYHLSFDPQCQEWQVPVLSFIFLLLFTGNTLTMIIVVKNKVQEVLQRPGSSTDRLKNKYKMA
ncbi:PREDICTED: transmembrane protein 120 homolog [Priapulus caudatus]|uniref:Transmembrane protein 120 homolog n=1 Tax=Priapulus caudatus TaxID=37621 RepID=A0ABM1ED75_PRICU|nr:PREDICTED: transmembrane protein 120 homolog [Priapulus caudatus]